VLAWDATAEPEMPDYLRYLLLETDEEIVAHNSMFDRTVMRLSKNVKLNLPIERWRCSSVRALAHSLPGGWNGSVTFSSWARTRRKSKTASSLSSFSANRARRIPASVARRAHPSRRVGTLYRVC